MFHSSIQENCSFNDISSSPDLPGSMHHFTPQITSLDFEIHASQWQQKDVTYEPSKVILFKGVPEDICESEILSLCEVFGTIKDIFIKKQKRYVFIQFDRVEQSQRCYESFSAIPATVRGYTLYVFYTGKDKIMKLSPTANSPSRFLVLAFNKMGFTIDRNIAIQLLAPYGRCLKVMNMAAKGTQLFVEMEDVIQGMRVKETLDGQMVFGVAGVSVYYAEEKNMMQQAPQQGNSNSNVGLSTLETLDQFSPQHINSSPQNMASFTQVWNERRTSPPIAWPNMNLHINKPTSLPNNISMSPYRNEQMMRPSSLYQDKDFMSPKESLSPTKNMNAMSPLFHIKEEKSLTILLVKNLPKGITARILFRLFGMYGNVMKVKIFFKNPENALVEYQTPEQAELGKTYLNNCPLYGNNIFVTNSKIGVNIDTSALKKGEETQFMGDFATSPEHRYKFSGSKNYGNIVPPSKVLHLSNLCDDKEDYFYAELFRDFGFIRKFTFLKGPERMALMELGTVDETVKILSNFHNFNINGKYLKVSFSKYQKIKDL